MVSYGLHNSTQSYGGGVVVIYRYESKPCFLPIYDGIGERGHVYICNDQSGHRLILSKKNIVKNANFRPDGKSFTITPLNQATINSVYCRSMQSGTIFILGNDVKTWRRFTPQNVVNANPTT